MKIYTHYSFDLWLTLIKSNPSFKKERALWFYRNFNPKKKSIEEVELTFRNVDLMCNSINENTGKNIDADEMYLIVICALNDYSTDFVAIDVEYIYTEIEKILFSYPPNIYCSQTVETLDILKQKTNSTFNILSNTAFIRGNTLKIIMNHLNLSPFFDFQIYSDEIGISKPHKAIFQLMIDSVNTIHKKDISLQKIIHIGDNIKADIIGASNLGLSALQINSNQNTILNILD